jgi:hypothetical protein
VRKYRLRARGAQRPTAYRMPVRLLRRCSQPGSPDLADSARGSNPWGLFRDLVAFRAARTSRKSIRVILGHTPAYRPRRQGRNRGGSRTGAVASRYDGGGVQCTASAHGSVRARALSIGYQHIAWQMPNHAALRAPHRFIRSPSNFVGPCTTGCLRGIFPVRRLFIEWGAAYGIRQRAAVGYIPFAHPSMGSLGRHVVSRQQGSGHGGADDETGARTWGTALAMACNFCDMALEVYKVKVSYFQKPYGASSRRPSTRRPSPAPARTPTTAAAFRVHKTARATSAPMKEHSICSICRKSCVESIAPIPSSLFPVTRHP